MQEKLEQGFAAKGLTDAVTGETLVAENDIYTVDNDIQFPTTRDFGVDGKMYPVRITSSNEAVLKAPDVNNAARVEVYRPSVGAVSYTHLDVYKRQGWVIVWIIVFRRRDCSSTIEIPPIFRI